MNLGAFSVSLAVNDLQISKGFYQKLGFEVLGGDESANYLIMKNGDSVIGLFQGLLEENIITLNPGWDQSCKPTSEFTDIRQIQGRIKAQGLTLTKEADAKGTGPDSLILEDPDGNVILIDQHRDAN